jgi:DNA-binding response OmpR family regulator
LISNRPAKNILLVGLFVFPGSTCQFKRLHMPVSPHILLIESERLTSWHLSLLLREWGYTVTEWRSSGPPNLALSSPLRPNLILLNPSLRGIWQKDGLLAAFMYFWKVPVLLISATPPPEGWLGQIAASSLSKPFSSHQLRKKVEETLDPAWAKLSPRR